MQKASFTGIELKATESINKLCLLSHISGKKNPKKNPGRSKDGPPFIVIL